MLTPTVMLHVPAGTSSFPVVAGVETTSLSGTSGNVTLPSSIASGNLLLIIGASNGTCTWTAPSGWTDFPQGGTNNTKTAYKIASGSEGASVTVSWSASLGLQWVALRITGNYNGAPEQGTRSSASTANPNPPSLTPSWGAANTLWIAYGSCAGGSETWSAYPTGFASNQTTLSPGGASFALATLAENIGTKNPSTFTKSGTTSSGAQTFAIRPA